MLTWKIVGASKVSVIYIYIYIYIYILGSSAVSDSATAKPRDDDGEFGK